MQNGDKIFCCTLVVSTDNESVVNSTWSGESSGNQYKNCTESTGLFLGLRLHLSDNPFDFAHIKV